MERKFTVDMDGDEYFDGLIERSISRKALDCTRVQDVSRHCDVMGYVLVKVV